MIGDSFVRVTARIQIENKISHSQPKEFFFNAIRTYALYKRNNLWLDASRGFQPLMISDPLTEPRSGGSKNQAQSAENSTCHLLFSVNA